MQTFEGRTVLVTGAGGSIGSELCRLAMSQNAKRLILVSLTENALYQVAKRLTHEFRKYRDTELTLVLGDAGDLALMQEHLQGVDTVVHAAAHKHLPLCELNPLAAVRNNVLGTRNLVAQAVSAGVPQVCLISSDKAVNPTSIMGCTKRVAELVMADATAKRTRCFTVRFGNVLDSAGSVLPLWREQLAGGGPLTLTDPDCERYFMTVADAVGLVANAIALDPARGTFVLDMGEPINMLTLAKKTIAEFGGPIEIGIEVTGLRPGEKLKEELHYGGQLVATEFERLFMINEAAVRLDHKCLDYLQKAVNDRNAPRAVELLRLLAGAAVKEAA